MDAELLRQYLEFYQDLGIKTLYRQAPPARAVVVAPPETPAIAAKTVIAMDLPPLAPTNDTLFKIIEDIGDCTREQAWVSVAGALNKSASELGVVLPAAAA